MKRLALIAALAMLSTTAAIAQTVTGQDAGQVSFANSGAASAQPAFHRGLAWMHNFQYPQAAEAFQQAQKADPGFVMAYWGEAMTFNHPVWMFQDYEKGRAALSKLGATKAERLSKARTERERGLLEAVEILFGEGDRKGRDFAYSAAMERLHRAYPDDVDIGSLYALSLLGLAHDGRDYRLYMQSAGVLENYYPRYRRHPGVIHYLIHSYDDPTHATLGLRAARLYGAIAPDSHHAQHMTSHIFIALGDWKSTVSANEAAVAIANRDRAASGRPRVMCGHYAEWLSYAYFQLGRADDGRRIRRECLETAAGKILKEQAEDSFGAVDSYTGMLLREWIEVGRDPSLAELKLPTGKYPAAQLTLDYGDLLLARGNRAATQEAQRKVKAGAAALAKEATDSPLLKSILEITLLQAQGLADIASGKTSAGLSALRKAASLEAAMPVEFGPPVIAKPSYELLGEELLAAGKRPEAAEAFRQALKLAPGRRISTTQLAGLETGPQASSKTAAAAPHHH